MIGVWIIEIIWKCRPIEKTHRFHGQIWRWNQFPRSNYHHKTRLEFKGIKWFKFTAKNGHDKEPLHFLPKCAYKLPPQNTLTFSTFQRSQTPKCKQHDLYQHALKITSKPHPISKMNAQNICSVAVAIRPASYDVIEVKFQRKLHKWGISKMVYRDFKKWSTFQSVGGHKI